MNKWTSTPQFEENVRQSFGAPEIRSEFVDQVYGDLMQRADAKSRKSRPLLGLRPAWTIVLAILTLMTISTLVIGPQRVYAEFMKLFGYIPEVGIVNLDQVRVLKNGVTQRHDGRELTALRGLVTVHGTDLWLEFSDEARPVDDAWLETPDGLRFDLLNWSYSPDEPGTRGVVANFPPLPPDVNQVNLALPEGWRIPLTWVTGRESSLTPANIVLAPTPASGENPNSAPVVKPTAAPVLCSEAMEIKFCVQAAARTESEMQVLVEAIPGGQYTPGSSFSLSMFDVPGETQQLTLSDADGNVYPVDENFIQVQGEPTGRMSTLRFPGAQDLKGRLSLNIPAVLVSIPLSDEITIDLGDKPEAGQTLAIDQTIDVAGFPVHFSQAMLEGDGKTSLRMKLTSDLLDDNAPIRPYILDPGRPEGIQDSYGAGTSPNQLFIAVELIQQTGLRTGILRIPLISASLKVRGPFTLTFDAPGEKPDLTSTPQIIENGSFEPLPSAEPLPMNAYQYTGRALRSGDLLTVTVDDVQSTLYAASPDSGFAPEKVAVLPGQVLAVYSHPDRQGIDYLTGEYDEETSSTIYRQLYSLRFGDPAPRLLIGQFEHSAFNFDWSYDGHYLAYLASDEQPGHNYQRFVRMIDLNCRTFGECSIFTADTGNQDLYEIDWSPIDYRIALGGSPLDQEYGASDIFLLSLDAETNKAVLTNLTHSPTIDDRAPAQWTRGGDALLYACSTGTTASNEYSLCRNDLREGYDEVIVPLLPWNMHAFRLVADRWLVECMPVMYNGVYSLRTYDLQNGQTSTLLDWPANGKYWVETSVSPDGLWAATVINDLGGLLTLNIETHKSMLVMPAEARPFFVAWVK
jgi:hypothetical protein